MFDKRLLERMASTQTFDCRDLGALDVRERDQTRVHRHAIDEDRARTALTLATSFLGSGQPAVLAQDIEQTLHRVRIDSHPLTVHRQVHSHETRCGCWADMILSGKAGISRTSKPACRRALTTAGAGPSMGISPTPLAPNGPCL